jgi:hypothetical protein
MVAVSTFVQATGTLVRCFAVTMFKRNRDTQLQLFSDCRVHDRLTFRVPDDLPPGLYDMRVLLPNVAAVPGWGDVLVLAVGVVPVA